MIVKRIFQGLALLWLTGVVVIAAGGTWLTNNVDTVAEAAVEATGIDKEIARASKERCDMAQQQYQSLWDRAVESNRFEQMDDMLRKAEIRVDSACAGV